MRRSARLAALCTAFAATGCNMFGSDSPVRATVQFLNGPTPAAAPLITGGANASVASAASPGQWLLSPDKVTLHVTKIRLTGDEMDAETVSCDVTYDKSRPGLTQLLGCAFKVPQGTYDGIELAISTGYEVLVNDATNGFFTNGTGIVTTSPAGGATSTLAVLTGGNNGEISYGTIPFPVPVHVEDTTDLTINVAVNALQFFKATVTSGGVTIGHSGSDAGKPDLVATVGPLARLSFYSSQGVNSAGSYCAASCTNAAPTGITSVSVYYTEPNLPYSVRTQFSVAPALCGPFGVSYSYDPRSYLGQDASGAIGWAVPSDNTYAAYALEMRMTQVSTLGGTTTLYCKNRTTDPAPAGGSYASGAPSIASPANSLGTYTLLAR